MKLHIPKTKPLQGYKVNVFEKFNNRNSKKNEKIFKIENYY